MGFTQVCSSGNQLCKLIFFFHVTCLHAQLCTQEQSYSLLQFKRQFSFNKSVSSVCDARGTPSYPKLVSWKESSDCCSWDGIECDNETETKTGQVIGLDLSCSWLQGSIHRNTTLFHSFPCLQRLNLAFNDFTMDLSGNKFEGEIPNSIRKLNSLRGLNLSHNNLVGNIPKSLGNLRMLEWLDLSSNMLVGEIPQQLTNLSFLAVLNLSQNQLRGPIPQGKQFSSFSNDSYIGNLGLCGPPLLKRCSSSEASQQPPLMGQPEDNSETSSGFVWKVTFMGYGCGIVIGLATGYLMFATQKPQWLVRIIEIELQEIGWRFNKHARRYKARRN